MYINIGQNTVIPEQTVIGVFDLDNSSSSHITRKFLTAMEKKGAVINISDDIPKSFVLCEKGGTSTIYLSQLSYQTLQKRSQTSLFEERRPASEEK